MCENHQIIHADIEPGVITRDLIKEALREQGPKGEAGRLIEAENYEIQNYPSKSLRLEFLNILRIDHLWMMRQLTCLKLSNNMIEVIENLDELVNLVELDLSFNHIHKIQNLDSLVNLEIFSLYQNHIEVVENMDALRKLEIFSIGRNSIDDRGDCVLYLRKFKKLKSLNMIDNPVTQKLFNGEKFRKFLVAYIPQLVYYTYRLISNEEKENARHVHQKELEKLEQDERNLQHVEEQEERLKREEAQHAKAYVEKLNGHQLFEYLFERDPEGQAVLLTGQEAEEINEGFKVQTHEITQGLFQLGQEQLALRDEEIRQYTSTVNITKANSYQESRKQVEHFLLEKDSISADTKALLDIVESPALVGEEQLSEYASSMKMLEFKFQDISQDLWTHLMRNEMVLSEQLEELNSTFERNLRDMVNNFIESAQGYFTQIREQENIYSELIKDHVVRYQTHLTIRNEDLSTLPPLLKTIMTDKESVISALQTSHDLHFLVIDTREDQLINRIRDWYSDLCSKIEKEEIERARNAVLEINHFLDFERDEYDIIHRKFSEQYLLDIPEVNQEIMQQISYSSVSNLSSKSFGMEAGHPVSFDNNTAQDLNGEKKDNN
ncbi:dynein regulatory complex subunit 3 [Nilaparvata lugens]|uniref:dynein regulatory complex subunit 3 n=1 Tax=Nilaparvata lugens TaxID=108931 RepID=UPI00193CEA78|nr:dynein regulatory complex subunit 3 [Nilaparvata lugens]